MLNNARDYLMDFIFYVFFKERVSGVYPSTRQGWQRISVSTVFSSIHRQRQALAIIFTTQPTHSRLVSLTGHKLYYIFNFHLLSLVHN